MFQTRVSSKSVPSKSGRLGICVVTPPSSTIRSRLPKKCILFWMIGPPSVPPHCCCWVCRLVEPALLGEVVLARQRLVLPEEERAAVELVGALLGHGVDDAARRLAELGIELAGEQLEFLHGLDGHARLRAAVAAVERVVVVGPVHRVVHVADVLAGHADRVGAESRRRDGGDDAGHQRQVAGEVPVERRQVDELLGADVAADGLRAGVDDRGLTSDGDRFGDGPQLELDFELRGSADGELDATRLVFRKPASSAVTSYTPGFIPLSRKEPSARSRSRGTARCPDSARRWVRPAGPPPVDR